VDPPRLCLEPGAVPVRDYRVVQFLDRGGFLAAIQRAASPSPSDCTGEKVVSSADVRKAQEELAKYLKRKVEEQDDIAPGFKM
jgi:hypothetical protein